LENKVPFPPYLGFNWRDFPKYAYLALFMHTLQMVQVWLRLVTN